MAMRSVSFREIAFGRRSGDPGPDGAGSRKSRPALVGELLIIAFLLVAYDRIRNLSTANADVAFAHAVDVMRLEQLMHIDVELPFNLWVSSQHGLAVGVSVFYQLAHITVAMAVLAICYVWVPVVYRPARNALLFINIVGMVVYWFFPTAPPRLVPGAGFVDTTVATGIASAVNSDSVNQYAAMPSLHIAWAVWVVVIVTMLTTSRRVQVAWVTYPVLVTLVIVGTGHHFVLDAAAGLVLALVALRVFRPEQAADDLDLAAPALSQRCSNAS